MDKKEAWNKFIATGKVQDYLSYCSAEQSVAVEEHKNHDGKNRGDNPQPAELPGFGKIPDGIDQGIRFD